MRVLLDADGLKKLNRAGVLHEVASMFDCAIPQAVYDEVIVEGQARRYPDAFVIEGILRGRVEVVAVEVKEGSEAALGSGERAVLELARNTAQPVVVSDDRRFLNLLATEGIPSLAAAGVIVLLAEGSALNVDEASDSLERIRPSIRPAAYRQAREQLMHLKDEDK